MQISLLNIKKIFLYFQINYNIINVKLIIRELMSLISLIFKHYTVCMGKKYTYTKNISYIIYIHLIIYFETIIF